MIPKLTPAWMCMTAALLSMIVSADVLRAAEHSKEGSAETTRLSFPEPIAKAVPVISYVAAPEQPPVALPTPHFTGITAVASLTALLACRKPIFRLIYR